MRTKDKLRVFCTAKVDASILVNMKLIKKEDIKKPEKPLKKIYETYFWCNGFPTISEFDNDEVIENFLDIVRQDTGAPVDRSTIAGSLNWDIYNNPKEITRSRRKPVTFEEDMIEKEAAENDSVDEMVDNAENIKVVAETAESSQSKKVEAENKAAEVIPNVEKRSKKRNDRPPPSEEEQALPARHAKRTKSRASKPKDNISKTKTHSIPIAQEPTQPSSQTQPPPISQPQPSSQPPTSSKLDMTKPISMILPNESKETVLLSSPSSTSS
jgi:hypothetical protein